MIPQGRLSNSCSASNYLRWFGRNHSYTRANHLVNALIRRQPRILDAAQQLSDGVVLVLLGEVVRCL